MDINYFINMKPTQILEIFDNDFKSIPEHIQVGLMNIHTENPILFYQNRNIENNRFRYKWINNKWEKEDE